jgi:uncharacterized protein
MSNNEFQLFVKPVGAECNLHCRYCYYLEKSNLNGESGLMDDEVLERYISSHLEACADEMVNFSWHGGEPLLAGIEFFRKAITLQKKYMPAGVRVNNGIQTNGTLLNDEWCRFIAEENFFVGISIDGPQELHNKFRLNREGYPSFSRAVNGYKLLKKNNIIPEVLCVINSENVNHPIKVYDFFRKLGARYITFLPLVEQSPGQPYGVSDATVPSLAFGIFLSRIFDKWIQDGIGEIKIQIFEEAARTAFNQDHTLCIFKKACGGVPVIERNGDFYSCDHYVDKDHLIGNIREKSINDMLNTRKQLIFGQQKLNTLPGYCINCMVRDMCNGECPKNRFILSPDGEPGLNYLCDGYRYFFNHCRPFVEAISQVYKSS